MPSVQEIISAFSESSSFDTWSKSRDEDEQVSWHQKAPVRFVRGGEFVTDYDSVEACRNEAEKNDTGVRDSFFSMQAPVGSQLRTFFQEYDDGTVHSTSMSRSPTEYTMVASSVAESSRSSTAEQTRASRDAPYRSLAASKRSMKPLKSGSLSGKTRGGSLRPESPGRWSVGSREHPHDESSFPAVDSLDGIMDAPFETFDSKVALPPICRRPVYEDLPSTIFEERVSLEYSQSPSQKNRRDRIDESRESSDSVYSERSPIRTPARTPSPSPARSHYTARQLEEVYSTIKGSPACLRVDHDSKKSIRSETRSRSKENPGIPFWASPPRASPSRGAPVKWSPDKWSPARSSPAKSAPVRRSSVRDSPVRRLSVRSSPARSSPVTRSSVRSSPVRSSSGRNAPAMKSSTRRSPAIRSPATSLSGRSLSSRSSPAMRSSVRSSSPTNSFVTSSKSVMKGVSQLGKEGLMALKQVTKKHKNLPFSSMTENSASWSSRSFEGAPDLALSDSRSSEQSSQIALHELCSEAASPEDITWRNALYLLSMKPHLANVADNGWTPLHITCSGDPPEFMVRGIMVAAPESARVMDHSGRLPLHIVAATSANPDILQLLVDEYPQGVTEFDDMGMLPLHRLLTNEDIELTIRHLRILLGQTVQNVSSGKKTRVSRRRGEHLDLSFEQVNELGSNNDRHEKHVRESYPEDIQISFKRLTQWKRKRSRLNGGVAEEVEVSIEKNGEINGLNPASLPSSDDGQLALHLAVLRKRVDSRSGLEDEDGNQKRCEAAKSPEILRVVIAAHQKALTTRDDVGRTPLLLALCGQDALPNLDMVELLLGRGTVGFESPPKWAGDVQLHETHDDRFTNPAMITTEDTHQLPLHIVAEQMASNLPVLTAVYEAYPGAAHVQEIRGRTPLHLALSNFEGVQLDPEALEMMLTDRVAQTKDDDGRIPYDLFVKNADRLSLFEPEQRFGEPSAADVYKQFFQSSLVPKTPSDPIESSLFLKRLEKLPPWMRRYLLSASFVQDMIHDQTVRASRFFIVCLHGAVLGMLLLLFRLDMDNYSQARENALYSNAVYVLSCILLLFHILLCYESIETSVFVNQCLCNLLFWVDLVGPALTFATALFRDDWKSETVGAMGAAATGFLWVGIIGYFARWWYGMAVFVGGARRLGHLLIWPLLTATALVVGFAQMFFTLSTTSTRGDCDIVFGGRALCTVRDSYNTVYLLLLGSPLIDMIDADDDEVTNGSIVLVATFIFLCVVFIINLVISVVVETSREAWEDAAAISFWESKLVFVYLTNEFSLCFPSSRSVDAARKHPHGTRTIPSCNLISSESLGCYWEVCIAAIFGGPQNCNLSNLRQPGNSRTDRMLSLLILPIWLCLGVFTFGILWPPQVRSWLFRASRTRKMKGNNKLDCSAHHFATIRNDLLQLKIMSYEKSKSTERQLHELQRLVFAAAHEQ